MSSNNYPTEAKNSLSSIGNTILNEIVKEYEIEPQDAKSKWQSMVGMSTNQKVSQQEVALLSIGKHREKMKVIMLGEHFFRGRYRSLTKLTTLKDEENGDDEFTTELKRHAIATLAILNSKDEDEDMTDATLTTTAATADNTTAVATSGTAEAKDKIDKDDMIKELMLHVPNALHDQVGGLVDAMSEMWVMYNGIVEEETKGMSAFDSLRRAEQLKHILLKSPNEHEGLANIKKKVTDPVVSEIVEKIESIADATQRPSELGDMLAKKMKHMLKETILKTLYIYDYIPSE